MLEVALELAGQGYRVHPLAVGAKRPLLADWPAKASTDAGAVRAMWAERPQANVGIACGGDLVVLDVDSYRPGVEIPEWAPRDTRTVRSPRGGTHLYYRTDAPVASYDLWRGGPEIKGQGKQVVAPGSVADYLDKGERVTGAWELERGGEPLSVPATLLYDRRDLRGEDGGGGPGLGWQPFEFRDHVGDGERNNETASAAGWLFHVGCELEEVVEIVTEYAERTYDGYGLDFGPEEVRATIESVNRTRQRREREEQWATS